MIAVEASLSVFLLCGAGLRCAESLDPADAHQPDSIQIM